mgnify:CR=1 FL=1
MGWRAALPVPIEQTVESEATLIRTAVVPTSRVSWMLAGD